MRCADYVNKYTEDEIAALNQKHTRQLLKERDKFYFVSEYCRDCYVSNSKECITCTGNSLYNLKKEKQILATREHIPNKQEAKAASKQRIKEGR